jgi:hypothetical protein
MQDMKSSRPRGMVLLFFGVSFVVGGMLVLVQPDKYRSMVTVEANFAPREPTDDPDFFRKQFAVIRSDVVLTNVIAKLKLNESWGEKYNRGRPLSDFQVEKMLKRELDLQPVNNTRFIEIRVYDHDPNEAAVLANAVVETYSEYRTKDLRRLAAADPHPRYSLESIASGIMDRAEAGLKPVKPNPRLAGVMMFLGMLLAMAGIVRRNSARISNYFVEMYREDH